MGFIDAIKRAVNRLIGKDKIESVTRAKVAVSSEMLEAVELWSDMYEDSPPWAGPTVKTLGLPSAIASEISRLVTIEMKSDVTGSARAEYLDMQYKRVLGSLRRYLEYGCAKGGLVFKPYVSGPDVVVDYVQADQYFPVAFDSKGEITDVIFVERKHEGRYTYTRLERHTMDGENCRISNKAYRAETKGQLGREVPLSAVNDWADLLPEAVFENAGRLLIGHFKFPAANTIDPTSPLGVSAYSRAVDLLEQADRQYSRLLWEFEGGELAVDADATLFKKNERTGERTLPRGKERLFRALDFDGAQTGNKPLEVFSPALRDASLLNGLNALLQRIEDACGLARGTFSTAPDTDARTATEIKLLRQRSYATVADTQAALQHALEELVYAMDRWTSAMNLAPAGEYDISFEWDDSVLVDTQAEQTIRMQEVAAGLMRPERYIMWRYGCSEEEALKMLPGEIT